MKLKKYLEFLNNMVKDNPKALDYDVVYSSDDEGNAFSGVFYRPSVGYYDKDTLSFDGKSCRGNNSVCIN